jgi:hypothetical protein
MKTIEHRMFHVAAKVKPDTTFRALVDWRNTLLAIGL